MGEVLTRVYREGALVDDGCPIADVSEHLEDEAKVVWVDLCGPSAEQLHELAEELGLHELAVEDAIHAQQRPKLDRYATHLFLAAHGVRVDVDEGRLDESEIHAFISKRWLITVRNDNGFSIDAVCERWDRSPDLAIHGVGFLLYGLLDVIVDGYFDTIQVFDDYYEDVSEAIFTEHPIAPDQQRRWFEMRRAMARFHRLVVPMREVISSLMRREHSPVPEALYPYFQDVYDHILRVSESSDSLRDLVSTIAETNLSLRDYHQNLIVKKVSSWAAIVAIPALITGYYGMNVPYPGFAHESGFVSSVVLMLAASLGLYVLFRRKDWL